MRRSIKQFLVPGFAVLAIAAGIATPTASAAYVEINSESSGKLLEVGGWSTFTGAPINQWDANRMSLSWVYGGENQQWVIPAGDAAGNIRNRNSQKCIATAALPGRAVYQAPCSGSWEQQWTVTSTSQWTVDDGPTSYITIRNPATGFVLDVYQDGRANGNAIVTWYPSGADNQRWHLDLARWNV